MTQNKMENTTFQLQETLDKLKTVRDTLKDANEINEHKVKELNEKVGGE